METQTISEMKAHIIAKAAEDSDFRAEIVRNPKAVISSEYGVDHWVGAIPIHRRLVFALRSQHVGCGDGESVRPADIDSEPNQVVERRPTGSRRGSGGIALLSLPQK